MVLMVMPKRISGNRDRDRDARTAPAPAVNGDGRRKVPIACDPPEIHPGARYYARYQADADRLPITALPSMEVSIPDVAEEIPEPSPGRTFPSVSGISIP